MQLIVLFHFQTPFVRQNTPHPKELRAKAHKLFGKGKAPDGKIATEQTVSYYESCMALNTLNIFKYLSTTSLLITNYMQQSPP
jgi:hypothetical protein